MPKHQSSKHGQSECEEEHSSEANPQTEISEFEDYPKTLETGTESFSIAVRASFIPGLLTLSEVDLILRGRFKPPFEQSSSCPSGGCFSNLTPAGSKKVRPAPRCFPASF